MLTTSICKNNPEYIKTAYRYEDKIGKYKLENPTGPGINPNDPAWKGWHPAKIGRSWSVTRDTLSKFITAEKQKELTTLEKLQVMDKHDCIVINRNGGVQFKKYLDLDKGVIVGSSWDDIHPVRATSKERTGYPTQNH